MAKEKKAEGVMVLLAPQGVNAIGQGEIQFQVVDGKVSVSDPDHVAFLVANGFMLSPE